MFELSNSFQQFGYPGAEPPHNDRNTRLVHAALRQFEQALTHARLARLWARLQRCSNKLIFLGNYEIKILGSHYGGIRDVRIRDIIGSEGRACDFDAQFRPLDDRTRERWVSIAIARREGVGMPPVNLVQVGRCFFVRDGHHRISVARKAGQEMIEAEITILKVEGHLPWEPAPPAREAGATLEIGRIR